MVSKFLTFEAPQGSWDVPLNSLKTIADLHLFWSSGLIKCLDVSVGLDSLFTFLMEILFIFVTPCFPRVDAISFSVANYLLLITPLEMLSFSCWYALRLVV